MKIRTLTQREIDMIDPRGQGKQIVAKLATPRFSPAPFYVQRHRGIAERTEWLQEYRKAIDTTKIREQTAQKLPGYWAYFDEMCSKFGAQGGSPGIGFVREYYRSQFSKSQLPVTISTAARGRDFLIRWLRDLMETNSLGDFSYKPVNGTYAGLPTGAVKGTWNAETAGGSFCDLRHLLPILPGVRQQRGKSRVINQDATANVRYIEPYAQRVRHGLKRLLPTIFAAWLNPLNYLKPAITRAIDSGMSNVEIDYKTMDEYFNIHLAMEVYLPVAGVFLTPAESMLVQHYITECFEQPVFVYPELYEGSHNWLSGIALTQDAETVYSVCLQLGAALEIGMTPEQIHQSLFVAIGDDVLAMVKSPTMARELYHSAVEECERNAMLLNIDKCRCDTPDVRFCRLVYEKRARRTSDGVILGQYPVSLALNNIVNPEEVPASEALAVVATLDRMDTAVGSPDYGLLCEFVRNNFRQLFDAEVGSQELSHYSERSWWCRVYQEPWEISKSPSYAMLSRMGVEVNIR